jgi:nucleotide-binding universal stress UspA family protein/predicted transcriptional regulator
MTMSTGPGHAPAVEAASKPERSERPRSAQSIVVALPPPCLDPERVAEAVIPYARTLAERTGAVVVLLSVVDLLAKFNPLSRSWGPSSTTIDTERITEAQANLSRLAAAFPANTVETVVRVGSTVDQVQHIVDEWTAPLLIVSSHTRSNLDRLLFGSVALDLVHTAACPVLVVRGPQRVAATPSLVNVVAPLDQSSFAEGALAAALAALGLADLHVHLLHVVEPLPYAGVASDDIVALVEPKASDYLQTVAQPLLARGYRITTAVRYGNPAETIAQAAAEQGADLIAMATHGRGGFHRVLLGSVAEHLLRAAPVPVLFARPEDVSQTREEERAAGAMPRLGAPPATRPALWERRARELMVQPVVVAHEDTLLADVAVAMVQNRIGSVPVVNAQGKLVGIITRSDLIGGAPHIPLAAFQASRLFDEHASAQSIEEIHRAGGELTVSQTMSRPVVTVTEDEPIAEVVRLLLGRGIDRAPVVRDGVPVGIVTRHDLLRLLLPADGNADGVTRGRG